MSLIAAADNTPYDPMEIGEQLTIDLNKGFRECLEDSLKRFDEDEFCVVLLRNVEDKILKGIRRNKWYGWLWLPQPRPFQTVFYHRRSTGETKRLWSLPDAYTLAAYSTLTAVAPEREQVKRWCDFFYSKDFHNLIRKESGIEMLTQYEYLYRNREKLMDAGADLSECVFSDPLDPRRFDNIIKAEISAPQ